MRILELSKFKVYTVVTGFPFISITKNGVTISKTALVKLGKPNYIRILINEEDKQLGIAVCNENDDGSIACVKDTQKNDVSNFRINNRDLLHTIANVIGYKPDELSIKVLGEWFEAEKMMLVDLNKPIKINEKDDQNDE